jgi:hypothetical protein
MIVYMCVLFCLNEGGDICNTRKKKKKREREKEIGIHIDRCALLYVLIYTHGSSFTCCSRSCSRNLYTDFKKCSRFNVCRHIGMLLNKEIEREKNFN